VRPDAASAAARAAAAHLAASPELRASRRVALYAALRGELPSRPLYEVARAAGKTLLWPRAGGAAGLEFAPCARWEDLRPERYGVLAPGREQAALTLAAGDLVLVPGLAFDGWGRRLGRGGGHYDRALRAAPRGVVALGVGFDFQRIEEVPVGPDDAPVAAVLTETGVWRASPS
jgi:5-formyltetrahydrofolate cyclo-ligase